jgi:hypothetical protein
VLILLQTVSKNGEWNESLFPVGKKRKNGRKQQEEKFQK